MLAQEEEVPGEELQLCLAHLAVLNHLPGGGKEGLDQWVELYALMCLMCVLSDHVCSIWQKPTLASTFVSDIEFCHVCIHHNEYQSADDSNCPLMGMALR